MHRQLRGLFGACVLSIMVFVFLTGTVVAQTGTTAINGNVTDPQGKTVAGATVTITQVGTESGRVVQTDSFGHYQLQALPPGVYEVKVELAGFRSIVQQKVELLVATDRQVDFKL